MIWITTLCLLAVAAWLFFNALNERRWVEAHSHDETVASDEGLLASFSEKTASAPADSALGRAAGHYQGARKKASDMYERAKQPDGALGEKSIAGRTFSKAKEKASQLNQKIDSGMKSASSVKDGPSDGEGSFLGRAAEKTGNLTQKAAQKVKASADNLAGKTNSDGKEGMLSKVAGKVSGGMAAVDNKLDRSVKAGSDAVSSNASKVAEKLD